MYMIYLKMIIRILQIAPQRGNLLLAHGNAMGN